MIVSHSARIAEGAAELAREMGGEEVTIEAAGGLDEPGRPLGTDAALVARAIERAWSNDGVLVLMDLGSAVLSAEMAVEMAGADDAKVVLSGAPLVEGAVAAAAAARSGASLEEVAAEAQKGTAMKAGHLGETAPEPARDEEPAADPWPERATLRIKLHNPLGLHARPAARVVQTVSRFDADVSVNNVSTGRGPAPARSLSALATLGARRGHTLEVRATGPEAEPVLAALEALAADHFGDPPGAADAGASTDTHAAADTEAAGARDAQAADGAQQSVLRGVAASPGTALGVAAPWVATVELPDAPGGPPEDEWDALTRARAGVRSDLEEARAGVARSAAGEAAEILDAQLLLLDDEAVVEPARRDIFERGQPAGRAWDAAIRAIVSSFEQLDDAYQRERAADVAEVGRRVLMKLSGARHTSPDLDEDAVVIADELGPADTAGLDPKKVVGLATARGGPTSHAAIVARAAGIPAVVGVGRALLEIDPGTPLGLDGELGRVHVRPERDVAAELERKRAARARVQAEARALAQGAATTRSGTHVSVMANAGSARDASVAAAWGADGIGLLRTEFLFLDRREPPSEEEQYARYTEVAQALGDKPIVLRTLDAGADKPLPYLTQDEEANPFLGTRGVRLSLAEPDLLTIQLRAVLRAANQHPFKVMFPMITTLDELRRCRALVDGARRALEESGVAHGARMEIGIMVEVPACALQAARFAAEVDFLSIGTNDLAQYTMAAERGNERVAGLGDALHPAVLSLIDVVCRAARSANRWVGVCGEAAGDPDALPLLLGLGVTELSVAPAAVATVKQGVRGVAGDDARVLARDALELEDAGEVRALVRARARGGERA